MKIQISTIQIKPGRREADAEHIKELADSIRELGLLNPITVDKDNALIAGLHRLEAAKLLGWTEIECTVSSLEGLQAELAEIDENFVRSDLSTLEYGEMLLRRKEIYEALHPEAKNGGDKKSEKIRSAKCTSDFAKSFVQDTAEKLGVHPSTVKRQVQTAKNLTPETKEIIKGADSKISKLSALKLSRLEPEQQKEAAALLAAKEIKTVDEYTVIKAAEPASEPGDSNVDMPELMQPMESNQELEQPASVSAAPYSLPESGYATLKESVSNLKSMDKDCDSSPDIFLAEYSSFLCKFIREIEWYAGSQYEAAFPLLTLEQLEYLRQQTDSACSAVRDLYNKIERNVKP